MFKAISNFFHYWYMRYLLVTELFIVDKWERHMFHIVALLFFAIVGVFNNLLVVGLINLFTGNAVNNIPKDPISQTLNGDPSIQNEL